MKLIKKFLYRLYTIAHKQYALSTWSTWVKKSHPLKIIIGASKTNYPGWFQTEVYFLNLTKRSDFVKMFSSRKINYILAEHVLEHLTNEDLEAMLKNFAEFGASDINIRIAVPDGFHADVNYIEDVRPNGKGNGADDHKNLFTYQSLSALFAKAGFKANPVEYWDENRTFHQGYTNDDKGYIKRSFINDSRNSSGKPVYTSLIVDFTK